MKRLGVRLTLAFVLVTLLAVATVAVLADWSAGRAFTSYLNRQNEFVASGRLEELAAYFAKTGQWTGVATILAQPATGAGGGRTRTALLLADANSQIVYDERNQRVGTSLTAAERERALPVTSMMGAEPAGYIVFTTPDGSTLTPSQQAFLTQLRWSFGVAALLAGGLGIILGLVFSRALSQPLAEVAAAARTLAGRQWSVRAPTGGVEEIAAVGQAFNIMADSLQQAETLRRNLMADIAHELRTPLTVMQGNLRALLDDVYPLNKQEIATLYDESRHLSRLVTDLRELALAEAGALSLHIHPVDLARLFEQTQAEFTVAADAHAVQLSVTPVSSAWVRGDEERIAGVLRNLVANALRHTPAGGQIVVKTTPAPPGHTRIQVIDSGPGVPAEALPHLFERFYQADPSAGGTGLGLAIAKAWVEAMGGQIGVDSTVGQGSEFWLTLPAASPPPPAIPTPAL